MCKHHHKFTGIKSQAIWKWEYEHVQVNTWWRRLEEGRKQTTLMEWASGSCPKIKDLTYQKQVQIYSNWENEIMPEKTIKRAKKMLQKKHRAFNKPTGKIVLRYTQELHLFRTLTSKGQRFSFSLLFLCFFSSENINLHMYMLFIYLNNTSGLSMWGDGVLSS